MKKLIIISIFSFATQFVFAQVAPPHNGQANGVVNPSSGAAGGGTTDSGDKMDDISDDTPPPPPPPPPPAPATPHDSAYHGDSSTVFSFAEEMPKFPGDSFNIYLQSHIKYPKVPKGQTGTVYIEFVVETDGAVTNTRVKKSSGILDFDFEAQKAIEQMPKWNPGKMNGRAVRTRIIEPIKFQAN